MQGLCTMCSFTSTARAGVRWKVLGVWGRSLSLFASHKLLFIKLVQSQYFSYCKTMYANKNNNAMEAKAHAFVSNGMLPTS